MNSLDMENEIRRLLGTADIGTMEGLLVDSADWGVNIRMTLNNHFVEVDLIKNWDGFEMILLDDQNRNSVQIDGIQDIVQILKSYYWSSAVMELGSFSKVNFIARIARFNVSVNEFAIITGLASTWNP